MSSLTDTIISTDSLRHFRESYNAIRLELDQLKTSANLVYEKVNEDFRFFVPNIVDDGDFTLGTSGMFKWSNSNDLSTNAVSVHNAANPSGTVGEVLKFTVDSGSQSFKYQARNSLTFGTLPGQVKRVVVNLRYAVNNVPADTYMKFGLFDTADPGNATKAFFVNGNLDTFPTNYTGSKFGIGTTYISPIVNVPADTYANIAIVVDIESSSSSFYINNTVYHSPFIASNVIGSTFNIAFLYESQLGAINTSLQYNFIDEIGYEITRN